MNTLLNSISPITKILIVGSEPFIKEQNLKMLHDINISEELYSGIISNAQRNGLTPLLFKNLKTHPDISDSFLERIKHLVLKGSMIQLKQIAVFLEIHQILFYHNIDYWVLKGLYLAHEIYPNPSLRPMFDLDILIRPHQVSLVNDLFLRSGFDSYAVAEHRNISKYKHHPYGLVKDGVVIELHKSIFSDYDPVKFSNEHLWKESQEFMVSGIKVKTLSKEVFLYHLCHHLAGHLRGDLIKLIWCRDIAEFIRKFEEEIDWDLFFRLYVESNANEDLLFGICFAKDWMGIRVPDKILALVKTSHEIIANEFLYYSINKRSSKPRPHLLRKFTQINGIKNQFQFLIHKLFPEARYLAKHKENQVRHKIFLHFFYVIKIMARGLKSIWSLIFNKKV